MITHYQFLNAWVQAHIKSERGASLVEYALLVALIAVVCIAAVTTLGKSASSRSAKKKCCNSSPTDARHPRSQRSCTSARRR